jgi:hypothetical protein
MLYAIFARGQAKRHRQNPENIATYSQSAYKICRKKAKKS